MNKYKTRNDVPLKYRWDLTDIFKNIDDFNKSIDEVKEEIKKIDGYVGCTKNSDKLFEFLEFDSELSKKIVNLQVYAMTINDQDLNESFGSELVGKTDSLTTEYHAKVSFFSPELLSLNKDDYNDLFKNEKLIKYKNALDDIYRYKEHVLNKEKEELSSRLTSTLGSYEQLSSTLLNSCNDYGTVTMSDGSIEELMNTNYRRIMKKLPRDKRKEVYEQFNKVKDRYANISAGLLDYYVKTNISLSKIHKYESTWDEKLFDLELSNKVFDSMIDSALETKDILKKYYDLKSKVLKIDKCAPWDAPIELYETDKEYTIEEACDLVLKALEPLGEDYIKHFKNVIDNRCIDFCQYKGKRSGGYCVSSPGVKNSKILMSFNYDLQSVSTIAHESGHNVHHQYLYENNFSEYSIVPYVVSEVASLTNEFLLSNYLINNGSREEALSGISNILAVFNSNFYGGILDGNFEREFYKYVENGGTLTKDFLYDLCAKNLLKFYPVEIESEYQKGSWISISHFYMFYYLFSYSICVSVASYVSKEILSGNKEMLDKYISFLKTGSDYSVSDIYKVLGVDLENKNIYLDAIDNFSSLIDKFDEIYNK